MDQATGPLADALARDLFSDGRTLDDLDWRELWAYITKAPPGTAIFHEHSEGWTLGDKIAARQLDELRDLVWRYRAIHFVGGKEIPFPDPITFPGAVQSDHDVTVHSWATVTLDELVSPEVRALLQGV